MRRPAAIAGTAVFFVLVPCVLAGVIPWWITRWVFREPFLGLEISRYPGVLLILAGVPGLIHSFTQFAVKGLGTPAPIAPTQNLVVSGLYRYVRNPMYIAVVSVIFGQSLLFGDVRLLIYGALFWLGCHLFVISYEEPTLEQTFGAQYDSFRANVPRWIPRLTPWTGGSAR
jgi:protein-S-isoprenylcysteine O-methyltransferase Ste14